MLHLHPLSIPLSVSRVVGGAAANPSWHWAREQKTLHCFIPNIKTTVSTPSVFVCVAQTCVDESRFKEQVMYTGQQGPPHQLNCPLEPLPPRLTWQKDCQQLHPQKGKAYLEFTHLTLEDQGNYTCRQQGNSSASFTVRLVVKGKYCL